MTVMYIFHTYFCLYSAMYDLDRRGSLSLRKPKPLGFVPTEDQKYNEKLFAAFVVAGHTGQVRTEHTTRHFEADDFQLVNEAWTQPRRP